MARPALFVHGVLVNADIWRNVIWDVAHLRRCIAPDLPADGASPVPAAEAADLSLHGLAAMLDELCGRLGLAQVDLVANDTGGAVAQVFAARYPERIRTLTLTNCDVHDNFPPAAFKPFVDLAASGEFGPLVVAMAGDLTLARSEAGFGMGYAASGAASRRPPRQLPPAVRPGSRQGARTTADGVVGGGADGDRAASGRGACSGPGGMGGR